MTGTPKHTWNIAEKEEKRTSGVEKRSAQHSRTVSSDKKSDKKSDRKSDRKLDRRWTHLLEVEVCRKAAAGYDHAGWRYVW